jgi:nicotinate-nucleotide adenylyltransferase
MKRPLIGLLGGTFDPIHDGHLQFASHAAKALGLQKVLLIPAAQNPLKNDRACANGAQRLEMIQRALADVHQPELGVYGGEIQRPGPSYTVDTLIELQSQHDADFVFLMGSEVFRSLPHWKSPEQILARTQIAVVTRPGEEPPDLQAVLGAIPSPTSRLGVQTLELDALPYSSTALRAELASLSDSARTQESCPVAGLQRGVWLFIKENRLYTVR